MPESTATRPLRAVTGALTTTIACSLPVFLVGGLAVQIGEDFPLSPAGLGLAVSVYFGVSALASVPAGRLVERFGSTTMARAANALAAGCLLAIAATARSLGSLIALLALGAAANAAGQLASNAALSRQVPGRRQGLSFGIKQAAIPVSTLLAGAAVPLVALTFGWRWAFVLGAGVAVGAWLHVPVVDAGVRTRHGKHRQRATTALVVMGVAAALAAAAANALGTFLVDASVARGIAPGPAGLTLTLGSAVCVVARVTGGWQADLRPGRQVGVIAALLAAGAAGLALLSVAGPVALVVGVVLGFGLGWSWPGLMNFAVVRLHPQAPAAATSITQTGVYAGGCLGPLALGAVAAHAGYPTMWTAAGSSMLVAAGCMLLGALLLRRHHPGAAAEPR
ncbi:MAG TPA: MFS transporter [Actinoplanes sp.]|nr:MFS transporter [Actinoplanes sp.]